MSHFTQLATQFTEIEKLLKAAQKLGHKVTHSNGEPLLAQGFMDNTFTASAIIHTQSKYDIAIQTQADGTLELVADWELLAKVNKLDRLQWLNQLKQQYALVNIEEVALAQGLSLGEMVIGADGSIELTVSQW